MSQFCHNHANFLLIFLMVKGAALDSCTHFVLVKLKNIWMRLDQSVRFDFLEDLFAHLSLTVLVIKGEKFEGNLAACFINFIMRRLLVSEHDHSTASLS